MHLLAAHELDVRPGECLAIEDSPVGIEAALAAGMETVAVTTELTRQKFRNTDILERSHIVDDPRTLSAVVRSLIGDRGNPPRRRSEAPRRSSEQAEWVIFEEDPCGYAEGL